MTITIVLPTVGLRSGAMAPAHARARRSSIRPVTCWSVHPSHSPVRPFGGLWAICWLPFRKSASTSPRYRGSATCRLVLERRGRAEVGAKLAEALLVLTVCCWHVCSLGRHWWQDTVT